MYKWMNYVFQCMDFEKAWKLEVEPIPTAALLKNEVN
jgi:hypothetical protein